MSQSPEEKCAILNNFFEHLFTESVKPRLPGYIILIWPRTHVPLIDQASLRGIINGLPCNKSGGGDGLAAEVLKCLDPELLEILADCVHRRMCNERDARGSGIWSEVMVQLIPKLRGACYPRQYRPIALLPILYRLYSRILLHMTRGKLDQLAAPQFACRRNHQAGECIFLLAQLIWNTWSGACLYVFVMETSTQRMMKQIALVLVMP